MTSRRARGYRATLASRGCVLLPRGGPVSGGVWLHGAIKRTALAAQGLSGWLAARDPRLVPGTDVDWRPPVSTPAFENWITTVEDRLGTEVRSWVVNLPADRRRRRFNLLLLDRSRKPIAFGKFTANPPNQLALQVLEEFAKNPPGDFWAPGLLAHGLVEEFSYVVTSAMPNLSHTPARLTWQVRHQLVREFQESLRHLIAPPSVIVHGDFGPWNVRRLRDGRIAVVDWEETTEGVVGADELWHSVCVHASAEPVDRARALVRAEVPFLSEPQLEAAAGFWLTRLSRPQPQEIDPAIAMPARLDAASMRMERVLAGFGRTA